MLPDRFNAGGVPEYAIRDFANEFTTLRSLTPLALPGAGQIPHQSGSQRPAMGQPSGTPPMLRREVPAMRQR
jgi:hypothetical protein